MTNTPPENDPPPDKPGDEYTIGAAHMILQRGIAMAQKHKQSRDSFREMLARTQNILDAATEDQRKMTIIQLSGIG